MKLFDITRNIVRLGTLGCLCFLNAGLGAEETATPVTISVAEIAPVFQEIPLNGTVTARRVSKLSPRVDGLVDEVLVDEGDSIEAGAVLLRLDQVLADIESSRAHAALEEARARYKEAIRQRDEAADLVAKKHIASTAYEKSIAEVEINAAAVKRLEAEHRRQRELVKRHSIRAPFAGVIGRKLVEIGQWVETGSAVFELVEIDVLRIEVPVPQFYFGAVALGTPAAVRFDALPGQIFEAAVTMKIPVSNTTARTFPIRIEMDNKSRLKAPGMSARVSLLLQEETHTAALQLPRDAVVRKPDGSQTVWVVSEENGVLSAVPVIVEVGRAARGKVEIVSGALNPGDRVVINGNEILRPGQHIRIIEAPGAS